MEYMNEGRHCGQTKQRLGGAGGAEGRNRQNEPQLKPRRPKELGEGSVQTFLHYCVRSYKFHGENQT